MFSFLHVIFSDNKNNNNNNKQPCALAIMITHCPPQQHTMTAAATLLPHNSYCRLAQDVFVYLNDAMLNNVATTQQIAGFNIFAVQRLFNDCGHLQNFASSLKVRWRVLQAMAHVF